MTSKGKKRFLSILRMPENKDKSLHYAVLGLALMGSFMIVSTNVGNTTSNSLAIVTVSIKQILFIIAGYTAMMLASKLMNFRLIYRLDKILVFVVLLMMIVPLFGTAYLGSRAWIYLNLGVTTVSIQPSEFCKPLMIVLIASYFYAAQQRRSYQRSAWKMLKVPIISYLLFALVILLQKDIGALAILTPVVEKLSELPLVDHVATRFVNAANPLGTEEDDLYGQSYQPANALYGIANSNIVGQGVGGSSRKFGYLTQADSDYILAIIVEETGIFGLGFIAICYGIILFRLFKYTFITNVVHYKTILVGTAVYLFAHFVLNVGGVSAFIPLTGVPLLFISSGGTALVSAFTAIGMCQYVIVRIRQKEMPKIDKTKQAALEQ